MDGYISDLHWVMPQCTYLLYTIFIPYVESHNWVNVKNLTSCMFPHENIIMEESHATYFRSETHCMNLCLLGPV